MARAKSGSGESGLRLWARRAEDGRSLQLPGVAVPVGGVDRAGRERRRGQHPDRRSRAEHGAGRDEPSRARDRGRAAGAEQRRRDECGRRGDGEEVEVVVDERVEAERDG